MKLDPVFVAKVDALYRAGNSIENVAFELGCSRGPIKRALKEAGTPLRTQAEGVRANKQIRGVCRQTSATRDF